MNAMVWAKDSWPISSPYPNTFDSEWSGPVVVGAPAAVAKPFQRPVTLTLDCICICLQHILTLGRGGMVDHATLALVRYGEWWFFHPKNVQTPYAL